MKTATVNQRKGFSLVELLLTLVLILCLAAASVFCYTAIHRQANLDEGVDRLQSILRFARAEAATTGRKVRLQFVNTAVEGERSDLKAIRVEWEPDFLTAPGVFQTYTNKAWSEELVNELVAVQHVNPLNLEQLPAPKVLSEDGRPAEDQLPGEAEFGEDFEVEEIPSITFYPDGSSDSAEIIVASRNEDDSRRIAVTVSGMLGSVSTKVVPSESETGWVEEEDWFEEEWEQSQPVSEPTTVSPNTYAPEESIFPVPDSERFAEANRF